MLYMYRVFYMSSNNLKINLYAINTLLFLYQCIDVDMFVVGNLKVRMHTKNVYVIVSLVGNIK